MAGVTALLDANVFFSAPLRDLLLQMALADLFRARWSQRIHDEWIAAILRRRPDLSRRRLERTRALIDSHARESLVVNYQSLIPTLSLPDPKDRHVLAAAIAGGADVIVTSNIRDFPAITLAAHGLEAQHPDDFLCRLFDAAPEIACESIRTVRLRLKRPALSALEYLSMLNRQSLPRFVERLEPHSAHL